MKKLLLLLLLFGFASQYSFGQKLLDSKKVPTTITKRFAKKHRNAKEIKWFLLDQEHNYLVKYFDNSMECEAVYDKLGKELSSKTEVPLSKLNSKISEDLRTNHKDKNVDKAYLIVKGPREKYYSVILLKSQGRKKDPLVYEAQYNFNGSYLTLYEPEIPEEAEKEEGADKYEQKMEEETDDLEGSYSEEKISKSDLPSPIVTYIKKNYDIAYKYKDIYAKHNKQYGDYYYIVLKKQGEKKKFIHYFDMYGKLIKVKEVEL
jgi:hypothetical protein